MDLVKRKATILKQLLYLRDIIDSGQIQKTAEKNGIKQSNLSLLIHELEESFNTSLIYKTTNGVLPTNSAQQIYDDIQEIEQILRRIESKFDTREATTGITSLWVGNGLAGTRFLSLISDFYANYPTIRLNILTAQNMNLSDMDLIFTHNRQPNIPNGCKLLSITRQIKLYTTRQYIKKHGQPKDLHDLVENHHFCLLQSMLKWPELSDFNRHAKHLNTTTDVLSALLVLIENGGGITLLPDWCAYYHKNLIELKKVDFTLPIEVYFICHPGLEKHKRIIALKELLEKEYCPSA